MRKDLKLKSWLNEWLNLYKFHCLKGSTLERYQFIVNMIDIDCTVCDLTAEQLQSFFNGLYINGYSYSTMRQCVTVLRQAVRKACLLGYVSADKLVIFDLVEIPHDKPKQIVSFSAAEVSSILSVCDDYKYGDLYKLLLYTGMRVGECIALRWSDVDIDNKILSISQTDYRGQIQSCKTDNGLRVIPLSAQALDVLQGLACNRLVNMTYVFAHNNGKRYSYRSILDNWHRLLYSVGVPKSGLHRLRHTYASECLRCGVSPVVLAKLLGHADSSFTLRQYCDCQFDDMSKSVNSVFFS